MMRKLTLFLLVMTCFVIAEDRNFKGIDTLGFSGNFSASVDSIRYTRPALLSNGEDIRWIMAVDDTSSVGFSADSTVLAWGFQTGTIILNSSLDMSTRDTIWDERIVIDTMDVDSFGKAGVGKVDSSGALTRTWQKRADTTSISGFACQSRWFVPEWDVLIRGWAHGVTGNKTTDKQKAYLFNIRRRWVGTRGQ